MDYLQQASVSYYRGYKEKQNLNIAIPTGELGSGLTVIVGENNSGKTTLLEALTLNTKKRVADNERVQGKEPKIDFVYQSGKKESITTPQENSSQLTGADPGFEIIPSRRFWNARESGNGNIRASLHVSKDREKLRGQSSGLSVGSILKEIEKDPTTREIFTSKIRNVFPKFTKWFVGFDGDNDYIGYETKNGTTHRADFLGDGVGSVFRILAHTEYSQGPFIIDEPELSLQPEAQRKLYMYLADIAKDKQLIISTHSSYFINLSHFRNGATYVRVNKVNDEKSTLNQLGVFSDYESLFKGANWEMPFLYDEVSKEIFFQDRILILEGQQDSGLIRQHLDADNIIPSFNIFGYGVRGFSNFPLALKFAMDLGLEKVAFIIDKGQQEDEILLKLKETAANKDYLFLQWSTEDIRDKECCAGCENDQCSLCLNHRKCKTGIFSRKGDIKGDRKSEFDTVLERLNQYFS